MRQIVINCYKYHGREDLLPAFTEEQVNSTGGTTNSNVSSTVGVLKMHTSGNGTTTHKIQIQASGSPQIIAASPGAMSGPTSQVCLDHAGYNSDVDVRSCTFYIILYILTYVFFYYVLCDCFHYSLVFFSSYFIRSSFDFIYPHDFIFSYRWVNYFLE